MLTGCGNTWHLIFLQVVKFWTIIISAEHIYKVAKAQYGEKSLMGLQWVESTISRFFFAEVDNVIDDLSRMQPNNSEAKEDIRKLIVYLKHNSKRIHYYGDRIGGISYWKRRN